MIRALRNLLLLTLLGALALPALAHADPQRDCAGDGDLDKNYTNSQLRKALDDLDTGLDEYSNCREVIKAAIASGSDKRSNGGGGGSSGGGRGSSGGGGGGGEVTPDEQQARANDNAELEALTGDSKAKEPEVIVGGEQVKPGSNGLFDLASASNDVPMPLLLTLIVIGLLAIAGGLVALRGRVPALGRLPLVSKIPRVSLPRFRR
ncbi:MAG TPA: hypothetical protein VNC17_14565 [Thermoleophilaceae bacterium]|nr:hypothetical protein [Thermoleophilaceae bacterium]